MNLKTNSASTKDWVRATRSMSINAYDPSEHQVATAAQSKPKAPEDPKPSQKSQIASQG
jgi:hypothetical protein